MNINVHCEQCRSKQSELTVESLFPQSYGTLTLRGSSETNDFFDMTY